MNTDAQRVLLKDEAYLEIKHRIQYGQYVPGTFLAERGLADELGMSKTPIRAAISRLAIEGFVLVSPQRGIVVRELPLHEILDHFDIRIALETFTVRRLAGRLTKAQQDFLQENLNDQDMKTEANNVPGYIELDASFHLALAEYFDNKEILRVMSRQRDKLHRIVHKVFQQQAGRMAVSTEEHKAIFQALVDGGGDLAATLMETHIEYGKRSLIPS